MKRTDIDPRYTFDLDSIFANADACHEVLRDVVEALPSLQHYRGRLAESADVLLAFLESVAQLEVRFYPAFLYAFLRRDTNTKDAEARDLYAHALEVQSAIMAATAWQDTELAAVTAETFEYFCTQNPRLEAWRKFHRDSQHRAQHRRSPEVEIVIAEYAQMPVMVKQFDRTLFQEQVFPEIEDERGERVSITPTNLLELTRHASREVRGRAWTSYRSTRHRHRHSLAAYLNTFIKGKVIEARLRGYDSCLEAALDSAQLNRTVFDTTLETFEQNLHIWHEYWDAKRQVLTLERLYTHDLNVNPDVAAVNLPYEQAVEWLLEALAPMGEAYIGTLRCGLTTERWVDVYPAEGKARTEHCWTTDGCKPFIFLQYRDDLRSLSALAHESGHAMHSYYTYNTQPHQYANYGQTAAEMAANVHQAMLFSYLLETHPDLNLRLAILLEELNTSARYLFRMPINARLEFELYQIVESGTSLDAEHLSRRYLELDRAAFGLAVEVTEEDGIRWADQSVLYEHFYSFQYTLGIAGGQAVATRIGIGDRKAVEEYIQFISSGMSRDQLDSLSLAGVDFRSTKPLEQALQRVRDNTRKLELLMKS